MAKTKLTRDLAQAIVAAIRAGNYAKTAASAAGISERTFYNWIERGRSEASGPYHQFVQSLEEASAASEAAAVATVRAAGLRNWKAAMVFLERRFPDRWRRRTSHEVTGRDAGPISVEAKLAAMSDVELQVEYERLVRLAMNPVRRAPPRPT